MPVNGKLLIQILRMSNSSPENVYKTSSDTGKVTSMKPVKFPRGVQDITESEEKENVPRLRERKVATEVTKQVLVDVVKPKPRIKMGETPNNYPKTRDMIVEAVYMWGQENKRKGSSVGSIKKWIRGKYPEINPMRLGKVFSKSLKSAVDEAMIEIHPKPKADEAPPSLLKSRFRVGDKVKMEDGVIKVKATKVVKPKPVSKEGIKPPTKPKVPKPKVATEATASKVKAKTKANKTDGVAAVKKTVKIKQPAKPKPKAKDVAVSTSVASAKKKKAIKTLGSAVARRKSAVASTPARSVAPSADQTKKPPKKKVGKLG